MALEKFNCCHFLIDYFIKLMYWQEKLNCSQEELIRNAYRKFNCFHFLIDCLIKGVYWQEKFNRCHFFIKGINWQETFNWSQKEPIGNGVEETSIPSTPH